MNVNKPVLIIENSTNGLTPVNESVGNKDYISMDSPIAKALLNKTVGEKAIITIKAVGEDGSPIVGVNVTATCNYCRGVTIGPISEQGQGIYTAIVSTTQWYSNSSIEVEISNEFGSAKLGPVELLVKLKKRGGCSIVQGQPADIALFVFLFLLTLFNYRKRRN